MMTLEVDGLEFTRFTSMAVSRSLDQLAGTFAFEASASDTQNYPFEKGQRARVKINSETVLSGFIERIRVGYDASSHTISIGGRDVTADIIDSAALVKEFQGTIPLQEIARKLLTAGGINIEVATDPTGLEIAPFEETELESVETTQTIKEALEPYCRKRSVLQSTDGTGRLVFTNAGGVSAVRSLLNIQGGDNNNVVRAQAVDDISERFNRYQIKAQQSLVAAALNGIPIANIDIPSNEGFTIDDEIRSSRIFEGALETAGTVDDCNARAVWESNVRKARGRTYTATVQGHFQDAEQTRLWKMNELVAVRDEFSDLDEIMLVTGIQYNQSNDGTMTTLACQGKNSYAPEPESSDPGILGF